jgi:hypothetical protein
MKKRPLSWMTITLVMTACIASVDASAAYAQEIPPGFHAHLPRPSGNPQYAHVDRWFRKSDILQNYSRIFNRFTLTKPVVVTAGECGVPNAFYKPNGEVKTIVLCYEFVDEVIEEFRYDGMTQEKLDKWVVGTATFVLFHEFGHALIDVLDLPITGREEDAVDQLATLLLANANPEAAYAAGEFFRQWGDWGDLGLFKRTQSFADEHAIDQQRFYNVLCWTYGVNPQERFLIGERIPEGRRARCAGEWKQLESSWKRILEPSTMAARQNSSSPDTASKAAAPPQASLANVPTEAAQNASTFNGRWKYEEHFQDGLGLIKCSNTGTYVFGATGADITGEFHQTGTCKVLGQESDNSGVGEIKRVNVGRALVRFQIDTCEYQGFIASDGNNVNGTLKCQLPIGGKSYEVGGKWSAVREQ